MTLKTSAIWLAAVAVPIICGAPGAAQSLPRRVLRLESERHENFQYDGGMFWPVWQKGAVFVVTGNDSDEPVITGIDKGGHSEPIGFSFTGGRAFSVGGLAGARDGSIAVIGGCYSDEGQPATFLALIPPDRSHKVVVRLWPYVAHAVTFAPDGEMWTIGNVKTPENLGVSALNVLRRFSSSGKLLASFNVAVGGLWMGRQEAAQRSLLASSKDRIGWLTNANQYLEFDLNGRELGRYPPPAGPAPQAFETSMALSEGNDVLVGTKDGLNQKVWWLDRKGGTWVPVDLQGRKLKDRATLMFDGGTVVAVDELHASGATVSRYTFYAADQAPN
jgi:hypothetical protein